MQPKQVVHFHISVGSIESNRYRPHSTQDVNFKPALFTTIFTGSRRYRRRSKPPGSSRKPVCRPKGTNMLSKDPVQVYCRLRPMQYSTDVSCMKVVSDTTIIITPPESATNFRNGIWLLSHFSLGGPFPKLQITSARNDELITSLMHFLEQRINKRNILRADLMSQRELVKTQEMRLQKHLTVVHVE